MAAMTELEEAYRTLDIDVGASEDAVRDARKTLAKVWHPDRYASDPELQAKAQTKLGEINAAFERIREAKFPPAPAKAPAATPPPAAASAPAAAPTPAARTPFVAPTFDPKDVTYAPKKRLVWVAIVAAVVAVALGIYVAITVFGADPEPVVVAKPMPVPTPVPPPTPTPVPVEAVADAATVATGDAAIVDAPVAGAATTFTLGSTHEEVRAVQGAPTGVHTVINETWMYGFSRVDFAGGKVVGWAATDRPLHVRIDPRDPDRFAAAKARGTISLGSTRDEVAAVDGPPTSIHHVIHETWMYGFSRIEFDDDGKLISYAETDVPLHVK